MVVGVAPLCAAADRQGLDPASPSPDSGSPKLDLVVPPSLGGSRRGRGGGPPSPGFAATGRWSGASLPTALGGVDDDVVRLRAARRLAPRLRRLRGPPVVVGGPSASPAIPRVYLSWRWVGFAAGRGRGRWLTDPPHGGSVRRG
jgi:hypothetical protein